MINHLIGIHPSFGLLTLRIVLGIIFIAHGYKKLLKKEGHSQFLDFMKGSGFPAPEAIAYIIGVLEFFGGMCIVAGLYTRLAAVANAISLFAAILTMRKKTDHAITSFESSCVGGIELAIALGTMAMILLMMGAGKFSLDVILLNEW
jgi:putative oxidoreductase